LARIDRIHARRFRSESPAAARRRLREAYRAARAAAPARAALVVIGRPAVLREPFATLLGQMRQALAAIPGPRLA